MNFLKIKAFMKKDQWRQHYNELNHRLDQAYNQHNWTLVDQLEEELEAFLESADNYLEEEQEDIDETDDLEPDEFGGNYKEHQSTSMGESAGLHYTDQIPPLYEAYLMTKMGYNIGRYFFRTDHLEEDLASFVYRMISDSQNELSETTVLPDKFLVDPHGYSWKIKPEYIDELNDFAKTVWEDRVKLIRKFNPNWEGYYGIFKK